MLARNRELRRHIAQGQIHCVTASRIFQPVFAFGILVFARQSPFTQELPADPWYDAEILFFPVALFYKRIVRVPTKYIDDGFIFGVLNPQRGLQHLCQAVHAIQP